MLKKKFTNILEKTYLNFLVKQEVRSEPFHDKLGQLNKFYLPVCEKIYQDYKKNKKIKIIGLTGGQGAGKSTITQIIKLILEKILFYLYTIMIYRGKLYIPLPEFQYLKHLNYRS